MLAQHARNWLPKFARRRKYSRFHLNAERNAASDPCLGSAQIRQELRSLIYDSSLVAGTLHAVDEPAFLKHFFFSSAAKNNLLKGSLNATQILLFRNN